MRAPQAPADVALYELRPLPPGAPPPPGARVAVALRGNGMSLAAVEQLLQERGDAQRLADETARQLEAARAELQRERAARAQAQARSRPHARSPSLRVQLCCTEAASRAALQAACDALRFQAALPPAAQLERLRLVNDVAVGGAALVSLSGLAAPHSAARTHAPWASGAAALAERADCAPALAHAQCRFTRV